MTFLGFELDMWVFIGFLGQLIFFGRFVVQWWVSEKKGKSIVPISFWYISIIGGIVIIVYAIRQRDPVFIFGQTAALLIYFRNLFLVLKEKRMMRADSVGK